jgi:DNA (cytosine-5)-methyltransferase 1
MRYGSVCSGIEAATAAWHHMGWEAAFFSEIEKFPCAVLQHHYPDVPLHGDFTTIKENEYGKIDLLVGGTPCQSFSVAGLRGGLDDDRGNLALEFCRLAQREQPRWIVWENVPGVLSSNGGRDFGSILGALEDIGYGLAYRVLDAQYFGVAQRRRRVFVVGYLGDWRPAAAVLFERHSMSGHPAPSREKGKEVAGAAATGTGSSGGDGGARPDLAGPLTAGMHKGPRGTEAVESGHVVAYRTTGNAGCYETGTAIGALTTSTDPNCHVMTVGTLRAHHPGTAGTQSDTDHIIAIDAAHAFKVRGGCEGYLGSDEVAFTISTHQDQHIFSEPAIGFDAYNNDVTGDVTKTIDTGQDYHHVPNVLLSTVRRLTPVECERLQGFPDNFTAIPWRKKGAEDCPDGPRYKALGNSMAVPVMRWIGERIQMIEDMVE